MKLSSLIKLCTGFTTIFATKNMDLNDQNADISEMEELFAVGIVNLAATEVEKLTTEKEKELPPNEKFEKAADVKEKLDTDTMEESVTNTMEESDIDEKILSINKKALTADKKEKLDTNTIKESVINENERKKSAIDKKKKLVVNEEKKAAYSKEKNPDSDKKKVLEASNPFSEGDTNSPQQKEKEKIPLFPEDEYKNFNCLLEKIDTLITSKAAVLQNCLQMQIKSCDAFQNTDLSKLSYFCDEICGLNILRTKFMSQRQNKSIAAQNITAKSFIYDDLQARCKKLKNYFKTKKNVFDEGYNKLGDFNTFVRELNLLSTMYYSALNYLKKPFLKFYLRIKSNNNFEDLEDLLKLMNQTLEEADYATASIPHKFDFITDTKLYHYTLIYLNNKLSQFDIKTRLNNAISKCLMKFKNTKLKEHAAYLNFIDELKSYIDSIAKIDEALNFIILESLNSLESKITTIYKYNYTGLLVRKHLIKNHF